VRIVNKELAEKLAYCRLSGMAKSFQRLHKEATENALTPLEFFEALLDEEMINRENNRFNRLLKRAKFPILKTIDQFDFSKAPFLKKTEILELFNLEFIKENQNLIFIGAPGTGKTHLSISLGVEACKKGQSVSFFSAAALGNMLIEMQETLALSKFIEKLKKVDLLIIDELGYVSLSNKTTQLLFQIFSERYERGSIIVNTNLEFGQWGNIFHDEPMTAAIIDRLIHNSKILTFNGESYRFKSRKANTSKK
jgi:DNA replication protein DnaC